MKRRRFISRGSDKEAQLKMKFGLGMTKGHSLRMMGAVNSDYEDPVWMMIQIDRKVRDKINEIFPKQKGRLINIFLKEVCKMQPRIIMDLNFPRDPRVENSDGNPFQMPSRIIQCEKSGLEMMKYRTFYDAHLATGISPAMIRKVCEGKGHFAGGFRWKYEDSPPAWAASLEESTT
jgi:hypothetical protein